MKKIAFYTIYTLFIIILFEFVFRGYYAITFGKPKVLFRPFAVIEHYYPGLLDVMAAEVSNDDAQLDILLLGGSVMTNMWGNIPQELEKQLIASGNHHFKIYNLATPAHTSRDSRAKFMWLAKQKFDVVVLYHAINEVRFNHCPNDVFKKDYSHVDFYAKTNALSKRTWSRFTVLPLVYIQLKTNILRKYAQENYMPFHAPVKESRKDWIDYGMDVKTAASFVENYQYIIDESKKRGSQLIAPRFAYFIPENYSLEKFQNLELNYDRHRNPVELWGTKQTVTHGIDAHNYENTNLTKKHNLPDVDMNLYLEKGKTHFDDLCHLTPSGSAVFAGVLIQEFKRMFPAQFGHQPQ